MKRFVALLLVLCCLLSCAQAQQGEISLPASLVSVQAQAFENAASIQRVTVPDGAREIASRAFAGSSLREIVLPESLSFIAEDAFDGCSNLTLFVPRDSYAHIWCAQHDFAYEILGDEQQAASCAVHSLEWADGTLRAVVSTDRACTLCIEVLSEDGALLHTETAAMEADLDNSTVEIVPGIAMPESFVLRATLVDEAGNALCDARTNSRHTAAHAEFESRTAADYPADRVMDFGDSGYAVLNEDVLCLDVQASLSGGVYTFTDDGFDLRSGDVIRLLVDGEETLVKVSSASRSGESWQVQADPDLCLAECYDVLKIDAYLAGQSQARGIDETARVFDVTPSLDLGVGEAGIHAWADVHLKLSYDVNLLGADYFDAQITLTLSGDASISLHKEIDTFKNDNAPAIQLYNSVVTIPGVPAPAFLNVSLPLNIYAKAGGVITAGFSNTYGFSFNTRDGFSGIESSDSHAEAQVKGELNVEFGPEVSLTVALFDFFNARLGGGFGLGARGEVQVPSYGGSTVVQDSVHACLACVDMDFHAYARVRGTVVYKITKQIKGSLLDWPIVNETEQLAPAYYSLENEAASPFGGAATFGWGDCPNHKYRVEVSTTDYAGAAVSGVLLTISGENTETLAASSPAEAYLYDGAYTATADFESGQVLKDFSVEGAKKNVNLQEKLAALHGVVSDRLTGKAISGAAVTLTLPDGSAQTASTDSSGAYRFENLPGGTYSLTFSKQDYRDEQLSGVTCIAGEDAEANASLLSSLMPDEAVMRYLMECFGEDLIQRMNDAQINLHGIFHYYVPEGMPIDTTEGAFLMMELRLHTPLKFTYPVDQVDYAVMREAQCALLDANVFGLTAEEIAACKELIYTTYTQGESVFAQDGLVEHYISETPGYAALILQRHNWGVVKDSVEDKSYAWGSGYDWDVMEYRIYE